MEEAVVKVKETLDKYPPGHVDVLATWSLLCRILCARYGMSEDKYDAVILEAIGYGEAALPPNSPATQYTPNVMATVAQAYRVKWLTHGIMKDLETAVEYSNKCLQHTPGEGPGKAWYLLNHGQLLAA